MSHITLRELYEAAANTLRREPRGHDDFEDTWARVVTDYGEEWLKKSEAAKFRSRWGVSRTSAGRSDA